MSCFANLDDVPITYYVPMTYYARRYSNTKDDLQKIENEFDNNPNGSDDGYNGNANDNEFTQSTRFIVMISVIGVAVAIIIAFAVYLFAFKAKPGSFSEEIEMGEINPQELIDVKMRGFSLYNRLMNLNSKVPKQEIIKIKQKIKDVIRLSKLDTKTANEVLDEFEKNIDDLNRIYDPQSEKLQKHTSQSQERLHRSSSQKLTKQKSKRLSY